MQKRVDGAVRDRMAQMAKEGLRTPTIARELALDPSLVRHHLKALGLYQAGPRAHKYTPEQKAEVLRLRREERLGLDEIVRRTGVAKGSVRAYLGEAGAVLTAAEAGRLNPRRLDEDVRARVVEQRSQGRPEKEILAATGVSRASYRKLVREAGVVLPPEVVARNLQEGIDGKVERYLTEVFPSILASLGGVMLGTYQGSRCPVRFRCKEGHEFDMRPNDVQQGQWCPPCGTRLPRVQAELYGFVCTLASDARVNDRTVIQPRELDVYVPSKRFGLELDGLYWHSEAAPGFRRNGARDKAAAARAAGLGFMMVYEDEWRLRRALVEAMIRMRLGRFEGERLDARRLDLRRLDHNKEFRPFFDASHLNGHVQARYAYGLFDGDRMVACASVRTARDGRAELARLASLPGVLVRGAAGRLIAAVRAEEPGPLVSYSDNRLSEGGVYRALGFVEETRTDHPSYYYTDFRTRVWRYRCRRDNDPAVLAQHPTEADQAHAGVFSRQIFGDDRSLWRIEDCGHRRWVLA